MVSGTKNIWSAFLQMGAILALACAAALAVNHFRSGGLPLVGDWSPKGQMSTLRTAAENPLISLEEARALFLTGGAVFVDARPPEAYETGHIRGAVNLPAEDFDQYFDQTMADIAPDTLLVAYCDGDACDLSRELAFQLSAKGYSHVQVLLNGWTVWLDAKLPIDGEPR